MTTLRPYDGRSGIHEEIDMRKMICMKGRRTLIIPIAIAAMLAVVAFASLPNADSGDEQAVGAPGDYNVGDIAVINGIIDNNGLTSWTKAPIDGSSVPSGWSPAVKWSTDPTNKRVKELNLYYKGLTGDLNLSGLASLTTLDCGDNYLTSLDVTGTALKTLNCYWNELTSLDVSGLTSLETLNCCWNELTSLNVSGLASLGSLDCGGNSLTSLDLSGLASLTTLDCGDNKLTSLNVSALTGLKELDCSYNKLTSLNVSALTGLKELNCSYNYLTSLNVSALTSLETLECYWNKLTSLNVSALTGLKELDCSGNELTSLNVSALTNLEYLDCGYNKLTSLNVSALTGLKELDCYRNELTSLDVSALTSLERLDCSWNNIASLTVHGMADLYDLDCSYNSLTALDVSGCDALMQLDCRYNLMAGTGNVDTGTIPGFTDWDIGDGFRFAPQTEAVDIDDTTTAAQIADAVNAAFAAGRAPLVKGSKTNADAPLIITVPAGKEVYWEAAYGGTAVEVKGTGKFFVLKTGSLTVTSLKAEVEILFVIGTLTVNGDVLASECGLYAYFGGEIYINGNAVFEGAEGCLGAVEGKVAVTGDVIAEGVNADNPVIIAGEGNNSISVGGNIVTSGIAVVSVLGSVTVNGNVTAGGDFAILCEYEGIVHVKGSVSAPNGYAVRISDDATVKIDGTVTVKDDSEFIYDSDASAFLPKSASVANQDGYDSKYTDGIWSVLIGKRTGGGGSGDGGGSNMMLIIAVIAVIAIVAGVAVYMLVIRPKAK